MTETAPPKKSDLGVRAASAVVMVAVAGTALWLGGWVWTAFVALVALGVLWEWWGLVQGFSQSLLSRMAWSAGGLLYVGLASIVLATLRGQFEGTGYVLSLVGAVIGTDVGAYFAGRAIGGPKIAPAISPTKTWAGLFGGMLAASIALALVSQVWDTSLCDQFHSKPPSSGFDGGCGSSVITLTPVESVLPWLVLTGSLIAIIAQSGDFFESWMKRRAGVKDSGNLIPGHGGLFDRVDGLLAVCAALGLLIALSLIAELFWA